MISGTERIANRGWLPLVLGFHAETRTTTGERGELLLVGAKIGEKLLRVRRSKPSPDRFHLDDHPPLYE
jgi:hypothetical protein